MQSLFRAPAAPAEPTEPKAPAAKRVRLIAVRLLSLYLAYVFVARGWGKFESDGLWARAFDAWGLSGWLRMVIGGVEIAGGLALLMPKVAPYAGAALIAVLIGTGAVGQDRRWTEVAVLSTYVVALAWIAYENVRLRRPSGAARTLRPDYSI